MLNIFHPLLLIFNFLTITISIAQSVPTSFCGKNQNREPFLHQNTTKTLTISHYKRVYRRFLSDDDAESKEKVGLGTRISLDKIPDHVPDVCKECEKPNGNCGVGLKCICHPKECSKYIYMILLIVISIKFVNCGFDVTYNLFAFCFLICRR